MNGNGKKSFMGWVMSAKKSCRDFVLYSFLKHFSLPKMHQSVINWDL